MEIRPLAHLSDGTLIHDGRSAAAQESGATARLIMLMAEIDFRRLYLAAGYPSMHAFCVGELKLSEYSAAKRLHVARATRRVPVLLSALLEGQVHLTAACLLAPHLTIETRPSSWPWQPTEPRAKSRSWSLSAFLGQTFRPECGPWRRHRHHSFHSPRARQRPLEYFKLSPQAGSRWNLGSLINMRRRMLSHPHRFGSNRLHLDRRSRHSLLVDLACRSRSARAHMSF
jgi:hypothetical protein